MTMSTVDRNVRYNSDILYLMFHQSEHVRSVSGADINAAAVQEGLFGLGQDVVINTNGQYDLTPRWIRAASPVQYEQNVPLYKIFKYAIHDIASSCTQQQMDYLAMHVLLVGNFDDQRPSFAQQEAVRKLILEAAYQLPTLRDVLFHSDVTGISCPGIWMRPNKAEIIRIFSDARTTTERTTFSPQSITIPILTVVSSLSTRTDLGWSTISAATSYRLYRQHLGTDAALVLLSEQTGTTYTDTDVVFDGVYDYVVTAILPVTGETQASNLVRVVVPGEFITLADPYTLDNTGITLDMQHKSEIP